MRGYKDKFGVIWYLPKKELCKKCGQPDSCNNCNCKRLHKKDIEFLKRG